MTHPVGSARPLVIVTGTGTGIGKTFAACGLVAAWARTGARIAGVKPIESGIVTPPPGGAEESSDGALLAQVSTCHPTAPRPYLLAAPLSPHLAARIEGQAIDLSRVRRWLGEARADADGVVLELPGGLFSPLTDDATNAELVAELVAEGVPTVLVLVAPDRLGVLHDVIAAVRAAAGSRLRFAGVILSAPPTPDASTGRNAAELDRLLASSAVRVMATLAWGVDPVPELERLLRGLALVRP